MILSAKLISTLQLDSGDIGAVKGTGISGYANQHWIAPETNRFHHFIVWMPTEDGADRVILEATGEGGLLETAVDTLAKTFDRNHKMGHAVTIGRLSSYIGKDVEFYRPIHIPRSIRRQAPIALTRCCRDSYGYDFLAKLIAGAAWRWILILLAEHRFRRLRVEELPFYTGKDLICTAAASVSYLLLGQHIINFHVAPVPSAFKQALDEGLLIKIY